MLGSFLRQHFGEDYYRDDQGVCAAVHESNSPSMPDTLNILQAKITSMSDVRDNVLELGLLVELVILSLCRHGK